MILSTLCTQIIQLGRQLGMKLFSTCYYNQPEVDILARRNRLDMNCYSFLDQEYSFLNVIVSCLIALKILKSEFFLTFWPLKAHHGSTSDPKLQKQLLAITFFPYRLNLLQKNGHRLKCLDKSLCLLYFTSTLSQIFFASIT